MSSIPFPAPTRLRCADSSRDILDNELCLNAVSKNVRGELRPVHHELERCVPLECETLKTEHLLVLEVERWECDSQAAGLLNGRIVVKDLATAYEGGSPKRRGFHGGEFRWLGQGGLLAVGTLSGMTNAGILREPVFEPACERCEEPGVMTGRLCGFIRRAPKNPRLRGCEVFGVYRIRFELTEEGGRGEVQGTIEGVIVCRCPEE
jgi:hypothetical protein